MGHHGSEQGEVAHRTFNYPSLASPALAGSPCSENWDSSCKRKSPTTLSGTARTTPPKSSNNPPKNTHGSVHQIHLVSVSVRGGPGHGSSNRALGTPVQFMLAAKPRPGHRPQPATVRDRTPFSLYRSSRIQTEPSPDRDRHAGGAKLFKGRLPRPTDMWYLVRRN